MAANAMQRANGTGRSSLKAYLDDPTVRAKLAEVASSNMRADDLVRLALMAASRQPELAKCSQHSVLRSLMDAAALGIKPGGLLGRGYLVPRARNFKDDQGRWQKEIECHFDPGWRGLVDIARRSGAIRRIEAHVVYESDEFQVTRNPFTTVRHVPNEQANPGPVRAAFAVAQFADGSEQIEIVWKRDLDKIRAMGAEKGPWSIWYDEMARKTAVRRLCKYLPYDPLLERALEAATDAEAEEPIGRDVLPEPAIEKPPQAKRLATKISTRAVEQAAAANAKAAPEATGSRPKMDPAPEESHHDVEHDPDTGEIVPPPNAGDAWEP